jgi:hypothetical protein
MKLRITVIATGTLGLLLSHAALAQGGAGMGGGMGGGGMGGMAVVTTLCAKEIATHCAATPRGPAAWTCLDAKAKELGPDCLAAVESMGPDRGPGTGPVARLCMTEIDQYCAGIEHGTGKVRDCLEAKRSALGQACTIALDNTGRGRRR